MRLKVLIDFVDITTNKKRTAGDVFEAAQERGEHLLADPRRLVELAEPAEEAQPEKVEKEADPDPEQEPQKAPEEPKKKPATKKSKKK